jgi:hypothetical protein
MLLYLTFGDQPSGVYKSQVTDFVNFLEEHAGQAVRLVAFISMRNFFTNRKRILQHTPDALVLPMLPKLRNWRMNRQLLLAFLRLQSQRPSLIMGRNVLATLLALEAKSKGLTDRVLFDGRGAISAEWNEYQVVQDSFLEAGISNWEKQAVLEADWRIAVSNKLVQFWRNQFSYQSGNESVIPCTIDQSYTQIEISNRQIQLAKEKIGFQTEGILLVYSGSVAGWQSGKLLNDLLETLLKQQAELQVLFLSKETPYIQALSHTYPNRIKAKFVQPEEVPDYLIAGDYGLLIRENTVTNQVAAPVKFAEYLACGLKVLISPDLGDYAALVSEEQLGYLTNALPTQIQKLSHQDKTRIQAFALKKFSKSSYLPEYLKIIQQTTA